MKRVRKKAKTVILALNKSQLSIALVIAVITIGMLIPFLGKPFHIDDPLFIWTAKQIQLQPGDPYGFKVTWYYNEMEMWNTTKNPPLSCYYIAIVAYFFGWSEVALHAGFLVWPVLVILGTYFLARRFCSRPLFAALLTLFAPVFLVSSTTLMCDVMMLAFWIWAIIFWVRGLERNEHISYAISAFFVAAAALTKYFGMSLILLLPIYAFLKKKNMGIWLLYLAIPVAVLAWYQWATFSLYGRGLLSDVGSYATAARAMAGSGLFAKTIIGLTFTGGSLMIALFYVPLLSSWRSLIVQALFVATAMIIILSMNVPSHFPLNDIHWPFVMQFAIHAVVGVMIVAIALRAVWRSRLTADSALLFFWIAGTFIFAVFVNWSTNGRSILPMAPAVGILLAQELDKVSTSSIARNPAVLATLLVPVATIAMVVTQADCVLAESARSAASIVAEQYKSWPGKVWFQGHWGFQYYMQRSGFEILQINNSLIAPGDLVVIPRNNSNLFQFPPELEPTVRETIAVPLGSLVSTMERSVGAGFYSDIWGPLPFAAASRAADYYDIIEIHSGG